MNWEVITAIATVIGVGGGLVSVIFLVLEVRRNAQAIEGSTVQSLMTFERDVFEMVADNAELYIRACQHYAGLTPAEKLRFDRIVASQMSLSYSAFVQHTEELIDDEVWEAYDNAMRKYLSAPGFSECWESFENHYPKSFRDHVNRGGLTHQSRKP